MSSLQCCRRIDVLGPKYYGIWFCSPVPLFVNHFFLRRFHNIKIYSVYSVQYPDWISLILRISNWEVDVFLFFFHPCFFPVYDHCEQNTPLCSGSLITIHDELFVTEHDVTKTELIRMHSPRVSKKKVCFLLLARVHTHTYTHTHTHTHHSLPVWSVPLLSSLRSLSTNKSLCW